MKSIYTYRFYKDAPMRKKLFMIFLPLSLLSLCFLITASTLFIFRFGVNVSTVTTFEKLTLIENQLNMLLEHVQYNVKAFSTSSMLQNTLRTSYQDTYYDQYILESKLKSCINPVFDISSIASAGYIAFPNGKIYLTHKNMLFSDTTFPNSTSYEAVTKQRGKMILSPTENTSPYLTHSTASVFNVSKSIIDIDTGKCLGILSFNIRESLVSDIFKNIGKANLGEILILDSEGIVISSVDKTLLHKPLESIDPLSLPDADGTSKKIKMNQTNYIVSISAFKPLGWYIINRTPAKIITSASTQLAITLLTIGIFFLIAIIYLTYLFSTQLTKPLQNLLVICNKIHLGNLDVNLTPPSNDELGQLYSHLNSMLLRLKKSTYALYLEQTKKREYALSLQQALVNPHFLYNSLETVKYLNTLGDLKNSTLFVNCLASYYKIVLSKGKHIISIKDDLELATNYIQMQLIVQPHLFTYSVSITEEAKDLNTLKLIIQPIVENAILHGFKGITKDNLHLSITIYTEDSFLIIKVADNGKGICPELLTQLLDPKSTLSNEHFGLSNIHQRIVLKFGPQYGLRLASLPNNYTTVTVLLPLYSL